MKKFVIWVSIMLLTIVLSSVLAFVIIFQDVKSTAQELYTPMENSHSAQRTEAVDVTAKDPFSALILGVDKRENDSGRSDTMIVLTVNPYFHTTKLLSIPRDTYTEIIGLDTFDKINHAYVFGGIDMSVKTVEHLLDIPIDYVATIDMEGFINIVDIVGGITVDNPFAFDYQGQSFPAGQIQLDGNRALKYVRMRYDDPQGDFGRQNRQKQIIKGVLEQARSFNTLFRYPTILNTLEQSVQMNIQLDELIDIQKNYMSSFQNIEQLYLNNGYGKKINSIYYYFPDEQQLQTIKQTLRNHLQLPN